jgi:putative endonuclease
MFFVYCIVCQDNSIYTGYTTDLDRRINEHKNSDPKSAKYVRSKGFKELAYYEKLQTKSLAMKRECEIKKMNKTQKLKLIN